MKKDKPKKHLLCKIGLHKWYYHNCGIYYCKRINCCASKMNWFIL